MLICISSSKYRRAYVQSLCGTRFTPLEDMTFVCVVKFNLGCSICLLPNGKLVFIANDFIKDRDRKYDLQCSL